MIIEKATFKNLHGHLNLNLDFRPDVNVLIGSNGSGKTSVLNAVAWTLSPASIQDGISAALLLSELNFEEIVIAYTETGMKGSQRVKASRGDDQIRIEVEGVKGQLEIPILRRPEPRGIVSARAVDEPGELMARLIEDRRDNRVLRHLSDLPGPLYLPLNRRWTQDREVTHRPAARRSTTAGHLPISEVLSLADRVYRQEQSDTFTLNETLRDSILTSLFQAEGFDIARRVWTLGELRERKRRVGAALVNLNLGEALNTSNTYFDSMEDIVSEVGGQSLSLDSAEYSETWFRWISEGSPIASRVERMIPLIEEYETDLAKVTRRSRGFLDSVNKFIRESGKEIRFSRGFDLSVGLPNGDQISSHLLSSGELQLLVLFTFLYFRFDPQQEFAVMVDEPELSLHVAWQNQYVNSMREANPNAQIIIATHSPEIAGPVEDAIIDISPGVRDHAPI